MEIKHFVKIYRLDGSVPAQAYWTRELEVKSRDISEIKKYLENGHGINAYYYDKVVAYVPYQGKTLELRSTEELNPETYYIGEYRSRDKILEKDGKSCYDNAVEQGYIGLILSCHALIYKKVFPEDFEKIKNHVLDRKTLQPIKISEDDMTKTDEDERE